MNIFLTLPATTRGRLSLETKFGACQSGQGSGVAWAIPDQICKNISKYVDTQEIESIEKEKKGTITTIVVGGL